jgi:hypothetical protein
MTTKLKDLEHYDFKKRKPVPITILGFIILIGGLGILINSEIWAILPVVLAIAIISFKEGFKVSLDKAAYIDYRSVFGKKVSGQWIPMNEVKHIGLVRVSHSQKVWVSSISANLSDMVINLNFILGKRKYITITSGQKKDILKVATNIAKSSNLKIYDATTPDKIWIDPKGQI